MTIRRGGPADAEHVIALFDEAVAWMVARGQTGQWGERPMSENERMVARVRGWSAGDGLWMAEADGSPAGALVVALLRVDCWAGAPKLVAFYEAQGFVRDGTFDVNGWPGQVFSMRLGGS